MDEYASRCYRGTVTSVYDGDTLNCTIDVFLNQKLIDERIRLYGIDTPELRGDEKANGILVRDIVRERIKLSQDRCFLKVHGRGSFGRLLADVYLYEKDSIYCLNEWLLENGHAEVYR